MTVDIMLHKSGFVSYRMDQIDRRRLRKNQAVLVTRLDTNDVLPHLIAKGVLSYYDAEHINSAGTYQRRVMVLLYLLRRK